MFLGGTLMLSFLNRIQRTLIFCIKGILFALLLVVFYLPYMPFVPFFPDIPGLVSLSRTMGMCYLSFAVIGVCFIRIYGGFAVGIKKSKEIIYSIFLATLVTDLFSVVELYIMSFDIFKDIGVHTMILPFILSLVVQSICIYLFTHLGNFLFFIINKPNSCTVIYKDENKVDSYISKINRYKKQWKVSDVVYYNNDDLHSYIKKNEAVFIFDVPHSDRNDILEYCYKKNKNIYVLPDVADVLVRYSKRIIVDDVMMFASTLDELSYEERFIKRFIDILLSGILIIITSPIMLVEAIAIKCYDKGPVIFKQERMTRGGKIFNVYKFRTMIVDAEKDNVAVLSSQNDSRITPVGKILRKTRLDELPQFFNIFFGDMTFVGPRPERESIAKEYLKELPEFRYRLKVKAGLTGLAQISGKYNTTPKDKLTLDLIYIEKYSIWLDLKILLQTFIVLFKSDSTEGFKDDDKIEFVKHEKIENKQDKE